MPTPDLAPYRKLLDSIADILAAGKLQAQRAVEREQLTTYHEVGRLIDRYLLGNDRTSNYGERLFESLALDLGLAEKLLRDGHKLYRWHPKLHARAALE